MKNCGTFCPMGKKIKFKKFFYLKFLRRFFQKADGV